MAQIAARATLAKGTVYLYFRTKEEIFSTILLEGWSGVFDLVEAAFESASGGGNAEPIRTFLDGLASHIDDHPELLRLDGLGVNVLKANLAPSEQRAFTSAYDVRLTAGGAIVERALHLESGRGMQLLMRTYGLTRGLWRSFEELEATGAAVRPFSPFVTELREALGEYWRGAVA